MQQDQLVAVVQLLDLDFGETQALPGEHKAQTANCDSNVFAGTIQFVAKQDIKRSEQLCISYVNSKADVRARQMQLQAGYGFQCQCPLCTDTT